MSRLALASDFAEEGWPSMDLAAQMLLAGLQNSSQLTPCDIRPEFKQIAEKISAHPVARNLDRMINRLILYPRRAARVRDDFDLYHVCDHSYSQIIHKLPASRTGVYCHDLDTFRCLLQPEQEPRPRWFRAMARHILNGMQKARIVFHSTLEVRRQIEAHGLVDPARLVHAPYGISPEFYPPLQDEAPPRERYLMHVGSCIPRKRIDVLLDVCASVFAHDPGLSLLQVGGEFTEAQEEQIARLGLSARIKQVRGISRAALADHYRGAAAVLQTSDAEGFGLPLIEAMACDAPVIASDIPVLREIGQDAIEYCPVGDIDAWSAAIVRALQSADAPSVQARRISRAADFSWTRHAQTIANAYLSLLN